MEAQGVSSKWAAWALIAVMAMGLGLRLHDLGRQSL